MRRQPLDGSAYSQLIVTVIKDRKYIYIRIIHMKHQLDHWGFWWRKNAPQFGPKKMVQTPTLIWSWGSIPRAHRQRPPARIALPLLRAPCPKKPGDQRVSIKLCLIERFSTSTQAILSSFLLRMKREKKTWSWNNNSNSHVLKKYLYLARKKKTDTWITFLCSWDPYGTPNWCCPDAAPNSSLLTVV